MPGRVKKIFFPDDQTTSKENLEFQLADFQCKPINLQDIFSPEDYKNKYNLHRPRLFLLMKERECISSEESENDEYLMKPIFSPVTVEVADNSEDEIYHSPANATSTMKDTVVQLSEDTTSSLIGTSEERKNLVDEMMAEYNASLNADKERELQSLKEESRKEALRKRRECRVQNEPSENCQYVIVSVHHLQCGIIKRRFTPDCKKLELFMIGWVLWTHYLKTFHCLYRILV